MPVPRPIAPARALAPPPVPTRDEPQRTPLPSAPGNAQSQTQRNRSRAPGAQAGAKTVLYYQRRAVATPATAPQASSQRNVARWLVRRFALLLQLVVANTVLCILFGAGLMLFLDATFSAALRYASGVWLVCLIPVALLWSHHVSQARHFDD